MSYVNAAYYKGTYLGSMIPDNQLEQKLELASLDIDSLTYNRISAKGFDQLTAFQKKMIQMAVCSHAEFNYQYGDYFNMPISGYSAGSTSLSFQQGNISGQNGVTTSRPVMNLLRQSGLTVRLFL